MHDQGLFLAEKKSLVTEAVGDVVSDSFELASETQNHFGTPVPLKVILTEDLTSAGAATIQFKLQTSSDGSAYTTVIQGLPISKANAKKGTVLYNGYLPKTLSKYLQVAVAIGTAVATAGSFTAFMGISV